MRTKLLACFLALLALVLSASVALATPYIATAERPGPATAKTDLSVGLLVGGTDVGDVTGPGVGLVLSAGRRFGDLQLLGEYTYHTVGDGPAEVESRRGNVNRVGLTARYSVWSIGSRRGKVRGLFFGEVGGGRHHIAWNRGGTLTRNDLSFGLGFRQEVRIGGRDEPRTIGWYTGMRAYLARAPKAGAGVPEICDGPCDTATKPSRRDLSMFWVVGFNFGR